MTTSQERNGQYLSINLGFSLGVTFGVFVSGGVSGESRRRFSGVNNRVLSNESLMCPSGAHLNPAVSLSLCVLGRHPWKKLPFFILFQVFGAFLAAATVYLQYYGELRGP